MNDIYNDVFDKITTIQSLLKRHQRYAQTDNTPFADTSSGQGRVLALLKMQHNISTKDLAYLLGIRPQSLNELLNKLEKQGLVERRPSENDKRVLLVQITEKGKNAKQIDTDYSEILNCLDETEIENFSKYLDRIITTLKEKIKETSYSEEEYAQWEKKARETMGDEQFEQLISMHLNGRGFKHFDRGTSNHDIYPFGWGFGGRNKE